MTFELGRAKGIKLAVEMAVKKGVRELPLKAGLMGSRSKRTWSGESTMFAPFPDQDCSFLVTAGSSCLFAFSLEKKTVSGSDSLNKPEASQVIIIEGFNF